MVSYIHHNFRDKTTFLCYVLPRYYKNTHIVKGWAEQATWYMNIKLGSVDWAIIIAKENTLADVL